MYSRKELVTLIGGNIKGVDKLIESGELVAVQISPRRKAVPAWSVRAWQEKYANRT